MVHSIGASKPVKFEFEGEEYRLRFTLAALKALAHDHNIQVMKGGTEMLDAIRDPAKFALILFHGLRPNHPDLTLQWIEENFDAGMLIELMPVMAEAISGKQTASPNEDRPEKPNGIGLLSGPSDATTSDSPSPTSGV